MNWELFFRRIGFAPATAKQYAHFFSVNRMKQTDIADLDKETLAQLGVSAIGDQLTILRYIKSGGEINDFDTSNSRHTAQHKSASMEVDHTAASTHRKGRPPPDMHEIYHVKMPNGSTERSRKILRNAEIYRGEGNRGTTGVRKAGRPVSPIDKSSVVVREMIMEDVQKDNIHSRITFGGFGGARQRNFDVVQKHLAGGTRASSLTTGKTLTVHVPLQSSRTVLPKKVVAGSSRQLISDPVEKISRGVTKKKKVISRPSNRRQRPSIFERISYDGNGDEQDFGDVDEEEVVYEDDDGVDSNLYMEDDDGYVEYVEVPRKNIRARISRF